MAREARSRKLRGCRTAIDVAGELGLTVRTLIKRYKAGMFPEPIKDGGIWFFREADIERFYARKVKRASGE